ncbi:SGNH/GDSL hydrolase family protein [Lentibacillus persicus]|nr:SGNH/GDSL hydrolase family protein [Lentibacillus persicus]
MKKRYALLILGILLIGITVFLIINKPETSEEETIERTKLEEQEDNSEIKEDETEDDTSPSENQSTEEPAEEPVAQLQELFSEVVRTTIDFFTNRESHVTALGDSLTQGVGDNVTEGGYVSILDNTINRNNQLVTFDNHGKRGHRSDQLLKRLEEDKVAQSVENADIVLITIGANDIMQVVKENFTDLKVNDFTDAKETYEQNLRQVFDRINHLNEDTSIYLVGIYNPFMNYFPDIRELEMIVQDWNSISQRVTEDYDNGTFVPVADLFSTGDKKLFADDNFHPSHRGYQLFARRVLEYLTDQ